MLQIQEMFPNKFKCLSRHVLSWRKVKTNLYVSRCGFFSQRLSNSYSCYVDCFIAVSCWYIVRSRSDTALCLRTALFHSRVDLWPRLVWLSNIPAENLTMIVLVAVLNWSSSAERITELCWRWNVCWQKAPKSSKQKHTVGD